MNMDDVGQDVMSKIALFEKEVQSLSSNELKHFRKWFIEFDAEPWDEPIEKDWVSGKLYDLDAGALSEHLHGKSKSL